MKPYKIINNRSQAPLPPQNRPNLQPSKYTNKKTPELSSYKPKI